MAAIPFDWTMMKHMTTNMNGLITLERISSRAWSTKLGRWLQSLLFRMHVAHAVEVRIYSLSSENSWLIADGETQPRSHCNDFWASSVRWWAISQCGVSGTYKDQRDKQQKMFLKFRVNLQTTRRLLSHREPSNRSALHSAMSSVNQSDTLDTFQWSQLYARTPTACHGSMDGWSHRRRSGWALP